MATSISARGTGVATHQSLPPARVAPAACSEANGYCSRLPFGAQQRHAQLTHLIFHDRPQRLDIGDDAELREPGYVSRVDHLEVCHVMPGVMRAVRHARHLARIECRRTAQSPTA